MIEVLRAAYVIGRRDYMAIIMSKAFIFFLLGPLFPLIVGVAAGLLGGSVAEDADRPVVGIALSAQDADLLVAAREKLGTQLGDRTFPEIKLLATSAGSEPLNAKNFLKDKEEGLTLILTGSLDNPKLTGTAGALARWQGEIGLLLGHALQGNSVKIPTIMQETIAESSGDSKKARVATGQIAQVLLFMLTTLLAGMVLSNLVEEKSNKIIEILAASIPMDSVFLGKLFAMLAMALTGVLVWVTVGVTGFMIWGGDLPPLPEPAIGWPLFFTLGALYFAMAYLMLGSLFLGIGAMAATVREVQTLSMPVTMAQLMVFFFAMYTVTKLGQPIEQAAAIFPFSSPFAMIARAAQVETLWHHGVAIFGQIMFAILTLRISVVLFRRNVMKSGSGGKKEGVQRRKLFGVIPVGR